MKTSLFILGILAPAFIVVVAAGLYPVALVDGAPIFSRVWKKAEDASEHFINTQLRANGKKPIDFLSSGNAEVLLQIKRETLQALIEDEFFKQEGKKLTEGFDLSSRQLAEEAVQKGENMDKAAKLAYDLSLADFKELVLLPQARRDFLKEILAEKGQDFDKWMSETIKKKTVRLFFTPFKWSGETVE